MNEERARLILHCNAICDVDQRLAELCDERRSVSDLALRLMLLTGEKLAIELSMLTPYDLRLIPLALRYVAMRVSLVPTTDTEPLDGEECFST